MKTFLDGVRELIEGHAKERQDSGHSMFGHSHSYVFIVENKAAADKLEGMIRALETASGGPVRQGGVPPMVMKEFHYGERAGHLPDIYSQHPDVYCLSVTIPDALARRPVTDEWIEAARDAKPVIHFDPTAYLR